MLPYKINFKFVSYKIKIKFVHNKIFAFGAAIA